MLYIVFAVFVSVVWVMSMVRVGLCCGFGHGSERFMARLGLELVIDLG